MASEPDGIASGIIGTDDAVGQKFNSLPLSPVIGVLTVTLHLPESLSLKAKRQVVAGLLRRVRTRFQVAAAEVGERDKWQLAEVVVACVSADGRHADEVLARAAAFIGADAGGAVVTEIKTELLRL